MLICNDIFTYLITNIESEEVATSESEETVFKVDVTEEVTVQTLSLKTNGVQDAEITGTVGGIEVDVSDYFI